MIVLLKKIAVFLFTLLFAFPNVAFGSTFSASSLCVMDMTTRQILYESNIYEHRSVASTTKIITCLIACESNKLNDIVTVTSQMLDGTEGSLIYLKAGDKISLYDLCLGMMLSSGNDAANAVAVYLKGTIENFAEYMNDTAKSIGMNNTYFSTPSGLDKGQPYSCAHDMALLASCAMENKMFSKIVSLQSADIKINDDVKTIYNHNKLLSYNIKDGKFIGVKTGFTEKAGRCLISAKKYENK